MLFSGGGEVSDCESFGNKKNSTGANNTSSNVNNISSSQGSLHSASSSQPDVHPFFKVNMIECWILA
jgi:hypothetical protein